MGCFGYFLVEVAFVVGQGVISLLGRCVGYKVEFGPRQKKER